MKNKVLVFGATGHLGAYTVDYLMEHIDLEKFEIIAVGRKKTNFFDRYNIKYYEVDAVKEEDFEKLPKENIHTIVNLVGAMPAATEGYNPYAYVKVNILGMLNILEYCRKVNVDRIIFAQTESDISGHWWGKENILIEPYWERKYSFKGNYAMYVLSKSAAMDLMEIYHENFGLKRFTLRCPTIYHYHPDSYFYKDGKKIKLGYRKLIEQAEKGETIEIWGNPKLGKDMVYVKDFAQYVEKIILCNLDGGVYNVGTGKLTTLEDIIKGMVKVFSDDNNKSKIIYCPEKDDTRSFVMDIENAKKDLGYEPKYDYISFLRDFKKEEQLKRFKDLWGE